VSNSPDKRGQIIEHLEQALALADELSDGDTGFLIVSSARSMRRVPANSGWRGAWTRAGALLRSNSAAHQPPRWPQTVHRIRGRKDGTGTSSA
jgi:hypothetical protein